MAGPTRDRPDGPLGDDEFDARWTEITEHLGELEVPPPGDDPAEPSTGAAVIPCPRPEAGPRDYAVTAETEEEAEGFVPPDPGPITVTDPVVALGWTVVGLTVLALIVLPFTWHPLPGTVLTLLIALLMAGAGLLLWRMPAGRDDGPGDRGGGAVV